MPVPEDQLRVAVRQGREAARRADPAPTVRYFQGLLARHRDSASARYQCARAHDFAGEPHLAARCTSRRSPPACPDPTCVGD